MINAINCMVAKLVEPYPGRPYSPFTIAIIVLSFVLLAIKNS